MPVGGRINRRDNLRSKAALTKSKVPNKNTKNKHVVEDVSIEVKEELPSVELPKSESTAFKGLKKFYVILEDIKLNENLIQLNNNEAEKNDNEIIPDTSRRKGRPKKVVEQEKSVDVVINETTKKTRSTKKKEQEIVIDDKESNMEKEIKVTETEKPAIERSGSRLSKASKPFVVEHIENMVKESGDYEKPLGKIPGLVMLDNIKNRRSGLTQIQPKSINKVDEKSNNDVSETPIPVEKAKLKDVESEKPEKKKGRSRRKGQVKEPMECIEETPAIENAQEETPVIEPLQKSNQSVGKTEEINENIKKISAEVTETEEPLKKPEVVKKKLRKTEAKEKKTVAKAARDEEPLENEEKFEKIPAIVDTKAKSITKDSKQKIDKTPVESLGKVPGMRMIEDIRKRKSEMLAAPPAQPRPNSGVRQSISVVPTSSTEANDKTESKPRERLSVFSNQKRESLSKPITPQRVEKPENIDPIKVPGLSTIRELKTNKQVSTPTITDSQKVVPFEATLRVYTPSKTVDTPTRKQSILSVKTTPISGGILSKPSPSPYKRPMSVLDNPSEDGRNDLESRPKLSRQSVTFNHQVEVKEILGNSFNSIPDEPSADECRMRLNAEIEKAKNDLIEKRLQRTNNSFSVGSSFSRFKSDLHSQKLRHPETPTGVQKFITKRNSDLNDMLVDSALRKTTSPPRPLFPGLARPDASSNRFNVNRSGALKKVSAVSSASSMASPSVSNRNRDNWKSFQSNPIVKTPISLTNKREEPQLCPIFDDDETEEKTNTEEDQSNKRSCLLM